MSDDVGGKPFPDGEEPDEHHGSHGKADEEFASVVFDEEFVRSAQIHEPSAVERMLAAAEARAEAEAARSGPGFGPEGDDPDEPGPRGRRRARGADDYDGYSDYPDYEDDGEYGDYPYGPYGPYGGALRPYRSSSRWHRPVAWVLAVVMGIGLVALAFSAVYRGSSGRTQSPAPAPTSSGVDAPSTAGMDSVRTARPGLPSVPSAGPVRPSFSAVPRPS
ncbi:SCO2584 family spore wall biosynthesis protein [Streptomyces decoyicus]|uniref:SCO2584 family spore wall biosynthesis protein n=1 Tax=Streptomyces decoyicus TaxID=249567 RepID=UPI003649D02E